MLNRRGPWFAALALALSAFAGPGRAQEPAPEPPATAHDRLDALMRRVADLESEVKKDRAKDDPLKRPTLDWTVQLQADAVWSDQDVANRAAVGSLPDGAAFRRARFGAGGDYGPLEYRLAVDFALSGRPSFLDVYVGLNDVPGLGRVRVGHFFEPFGLEQSSQNRFLTFLERALPADPIAPGRNLGVMANSTFAGDRGTWAVGVFRTDSDVFGDDAGNDFRSAVTGRATVLPWYDEEGDGRDLLHLGLAYSARATKNGQVRFALRPEIRIGATTPNVPNFVDTGAVAAPFYQLVGSEFLLVRGPFSAQAEYVLVAVDARGGGTAHLRTGYVLGSVFLTGEHRTYQRSTGTLDRIRPRGDFVRSDARGLGHGPGAVELAVRLSHIDLNDGPVRGGRLTNATAVVNWYLNPYLRFTAEYIRTFQTPRSGRAGTADFYGLRVGFDF